MNTKVLAIAIAFTAVTVVLNPRFSGIAIPSFLTPGLWFQIWEIPVFAAFLILGLKASVLISILNTVVLQAVSPGVPFNVPLVNLIAVLNTLPGIYLAHKLTIRRETCRYSNPELREILFSTAFGVLFRVATMIPVICAIAIFFGTAPIILPRLSLIAVYDAIVVLYSVPLGYLVAKAVNKHLKLEIET